MRQSASAPGRKVSAPRSVPRAHCDPSAPITGRPRPSCIVRAMSFVVLAHWRSVRAQLRSVLA
jgi:hypothetical protein